MPESTLMDYERVLEAQLGAISSYHILTSKESSKVIRDLSKVIDSMSVTLRRELIELDKSLTTND